MLVTALAWDTFKGKYAIGRITRGQVKAGDQVALCKKDGTVSKAKVDNVYMSHGVSRFEVPGGVAGDIVQLTGVGDAQIGETVADAEQPEALPVLEVEAPTLKIYLDQTLVHSKVLKASLVLHVKLVNALIKSSKLTLVYAWIKTALAFWSVVAVNST
jgi:predicted membrane GTPase involved in stress response